MYASLIASVVYQIHFDFDLDLNFLHLRLFSHLFNMSNHNKTRGCANNFRAAVCICLQYLRNSGKESCSPMTEEMVSR